MHFHLGSQITDIRFVKAGLEEIGRYYVELRRHGVRRLTHVDVGGGLGVDYDGSRSTRPASVNYTMREYANDVVYTLGTACRSEELPMPNIISESGRALTAHHALLLVNVIDVESLIEPVAAGAAGGSPPAAGGDDGEPRGAHARTGSRRCSTTRSSPRSGRRSTSRSGVFSLRDKARRRAVLPGHAERARSRLIARGPDVVPRDREPTSRRRWSTATSATSRCSSRCRTTGPSTSSSRSCRSTGCTSSRPGGAPSRTSPAIPTA